MAASIDSLLEEISGVQDPTEELQSLKLALLSIPVSALRDAVSGQREQVELCVDILERILKALRSVVTGPELQSGAARRLVEYWSTPTLPLKSSTTTTILRAVIQCIGEDNMAVAKQAIQCLSKLSHSKPWLVVEISSVSPISLGYCANSSLISQLIGELTGDDVLIRATAIEMVTTLAHSQHGRQYLAQQGIMDKISNMIRGADTDPFSSLYLPGLVKFFGNLAIMDSPQQVCETYPAFQNKVFEMALDPDPVMIGVALDTLGLLGSTVEGKQVLQKTGEKFKAVLLRMSQLASSGATELRPEQQTEDLLALTESWFHLLSNQPMDMIQNISSQPFPELHCGAMRIFTAIATQPWGQKLMISTPSFMEFVLDRSAGQTKEAKDAKFELVGSLVCSSTAAEILGSQHYIRLKTYLREGPYYVSAVASVSTEGAD
ncbi:26S proteasome non-ATPase regulatory subunit 5 [Nibea albiflora]|uniref:26S proteasome non-ATPase regulatory subunit 5 n=1 Tax=Nibea albiflora TaxID=240163 RepID=A0ACB7F8S1_NIBAL|nr:26S proteasome non-ATPase regulatory subunit 5 [Nibea albiflora]